MRTCDTCKNYDAERRPCRWCKNMNGWEEKPQTRADRIRAMTDEEMAEWLDSVSKSWYDEGYTKETDEPLMSTYPSTAGRWIAWLKEEQS